MTIAPTDFPARSGWRKWAQLVATTIFCCVALGSMTYLVFTDLPGIAALWQQADLSRLVAATAALCLAMVPFGAATVINLGMLGYPVPFVACCNAYFTSQLGKYVPGKVWLFFIRQRHYAMLGVPAAVSFFSMGIELLLSIAGALLTVVIMAFFGQAGGYPLPLKIAGPLLAAVLLLCSPPILNFILARLQRRMNAPQGGSKRIGAIHIVAVLADYIAGWLLVGLAFVLLAKASLPLSVTFLPTATGTFALAYVAGYLVPLAPAGLGARELALTAALVPSLGTTNAAALAILARIWWTIGEFACIALFALLTRVLTARHGNKSEA